MTEKSKAAHVSSMNYANLHAPSLDEWQKKFVTLYAERLRDTGVIEKIIADGTPGFFGFSGVSMFFQYMVEIIPDPENPAFVEAIELMEPVCRIKTAFEVTAQSRSAAQASTTAQVKQRPTGFIYIAKSDGNPGMLKIGMTTKSIASRLKQLSNSTTSVHPFVLVEGFACTDPLAAEKAIHAELDAYRVHSGREFFAISEADAIAVCKRVVGGAA